MRRGRGKHMDEADFIIRAVYLWKIRGSFLKHKGALIHGDGLLGPTPPFFSRF
jgi:hypothetical protein